MIGPEDVPPEEPWGPWQDETTHHIDRLSRMMRSGEGDDPVPSYVPDNWGTPPPSDSERLQQGRHVPELEKYLGESGSSVHRVTVLSDIPRLIGGLKSTSFIVNNGEDSADTVPEEGMRVDLRNSMIEAQDISSFADFFARAERQADAQYADALFAAQQVVADARERGIDIGVLLIPETVNMSASDYFDRLQRLAQDLGIPVVINTEDHSDGFDYEEFREFKPPTAASPEAYWEKRAQEAREPERTRISDPPSTEELEAALDQFWDTRGEDDRAFQTVLWTLASATPETLAEVLNENHLYVLRDLAHYSGDDYDKYRPSVYSRVIVAKLADMPLFERLMHEARDHYWHGETEKIAVPLGLYARNDSGVRDHLVAATEFAAQNRADTTEGVPLSQLLGALYRSFSPELGPYLAQYLRVEQPEGHDVQQAYTTRSSTIEEMPKFVDAVGALPESEARTAALEAIKQAALSTLDHDVSPINQGDQLARLRLTAGDVLLRMGVADQKEHLQKHMLWLYENQGSYIGNKYFEEQYIQYRNLYGDIPEISAHITIG